MKENVKEVWKQIPGFEGYEASNTGLIRSHLRGVPKVLKFAKNNRGYFIVGVRRDMSTHHKLVHRLIAMTFLGESNLVVDHVNNNKEDNKLSNLRYCTQRENTTNGNFTTSIIKKYSKFIGVTKSKGRQKEWKSTIRINGKSTYLGNFYTEQEAVNAYQNKLKQIV
jgi:hypothetical protein